MKAMQQRRGGAIQKTGQGKAKSKSKVTSKATSTPTGRVVWPKREDKGFGEMNRVGKRRAGVLGIGNNGIKGIKKKRKKRKKYYVPLIRSHK